jgi:hypothetical protein
MVAAEGKTFDERASTFHDHLSVFFAMNNHPDAPDSAFVPVWQSNPLKHACCPLKANTYSTKCICDF